MLKQKIKKNLNLNTEIDDLTQIINDQNTNEQNKQDSKNKQYLNSISNLKRKKQDQKNILSKLAHFGDLKLQQKDSNH